jgi:hypothetical protein
MEFSEFIREGQFLSNPSAERNKTARVAVSERSWRNLRAGLP